MPDESYVICILKIESVAKRSLEFGELTLKSASLALAIAICSNIIMFSRTFDSKVTKRRKIFPLLTVNSSRDRDFVLCLVRRVDSEGSKRRMGKLVHFHHIWSSSSGQNHKLGGVFANQVLKHAI